MFSVQELQVIRDAIIKFNNDNPKYPPGFLTDFIFDGYDYVCEKENIIDFHAIIQRMLYYHLKEAAVNNDYYSEETYSEEMPLWNNTDKSYEYKLDKQNAVIGKIASDHINDMGVIARYRSCEDNDILIVNIINDAQIIFDDWAKINALHEKGILFDVYEFEHFFNIACDTITYNLDTTLARLDERRTIKSKQAKVRYIDLDEWKEEACEEARRRWRNGSNLLHYKMAGELMKIDKFKTLPDGEYPKAVLRRILIKVGDEPEFKGRRLIFGKHYKE